MKKINKYLYISVFFIFIISIICFDVYFTKYKNKDKREIAIVNGKIHIYEEDIKDRLKFLSFNKKIKIENFPEDIVATMILESLINNDIQKYAHKKGIDKDKEILRLVENYKQNLIKEKYFEKTIYKDITDNEITTEYAKILENIQGKEERKIKHILVETEEESRKIKKRLQKENFEKVAKEVSIDEGSKNYGGNLGYVIKEDLVPEFGNIAFMLKKDQISNPIKTKYGWHIIKVDDIKPLKIEDLEKSKKMLRERLQQERLEKFLMNETKKYNINFKIKFEKKEIE